MKIAEKSVKIAEIVEKSAKIVEKGLMKTAENRAILPKRPSNWQKMSEKNWENAGESIHMI